VDSLQEEVRLMRAAMADMLAGMLPVFQSLDHIQQAAVKMRLLEERDERI
jgi:hypothetical protein